MTTTHKVLLVEDDPMIVRMYERKLTHEGYELALAYNGEEGLEALKKSRPDIVLLDVMMPKMNGLEMLKIVKNDPQYANVPIIILTNLSDHPEDVEKCKELGATDYWVKANIRLDELAERIESILKEK
jgi:two-component system alkaline phosphatase synthesis response regulator PhoP